MRVEIMMAALVGVFSVAVFCLGIARREVTLIGLSILWLGVAATLAASNSAFTPKDKTDE